MLNFYGSFFTLIYVCTHCTETETYAKVYDHADHAIILHNVYDMGAPELVIR